MVNNADRLIQTMQHAGVRRLFGSGGSAGEIFAAAERAGLAYARAHSAGAAAFMACGHAERTGYPGGCAVPAGTSVAAIAPAWRYACTEGVPLLTVAEEGGEECGIAAGWVEHRFRLEAHRACEELQALLAALRHRPAGPLHLSASTEVLETPVSPAWTPPAAPAAPEAVVVLAEPARRLLREACRPVLLLGPGARGVDTARVARHLAGDAGVPVVATPRAKGVVGDRHPWFAGVLTEQGRQNPLLKRADLFLLAGFEDGVTALGHWPYSQPVVALPAEGLAVSLQAAATELPEHSGWTTAELHALAREQQAAVSLETAVESAYYGRTIELAAAEWRDAVAVVDGGAHWSGAIRCWPVREPGELLTPGGDAPAEYALPAAIGAALVDPARDVAVILSQEGLLAAAPELETAARYKLRLRVLVFVERDTAIDWAGLGAALGVPACAPVDEETLRTALRQAAAFAGPALVAKGDMR
jgi:acetolactate synthase I/II/III large subunit